MDKQQVAEQIAAQGVLPLMSNQDKEKCLRLLNASYRAGIRVFEFACRYPNAEEIFVALKEHAKKNLPGMILGVGTMITRADAKKYIKLGTAFIVAPLLDEEVGKYCREKKVFWCPGAGTLTEIVKAHQAGADLVKIFPAETLGGPAFVRAIKAPCPWVNVMPTGGVTLEEENLRNWFQAGVNAVGIGSALFRKDLVEHASDDDLEQAVSNLLNTIRRVRVPAA